MNAVLRMEMIYGSCKISDYFDIPSDISCNVRHFEAEKRDPFSILEATRHSETRQVSLSCTVDCLEAQLKQFNFVLSNTLHI